MPRNLAAGSAVALFMLLTLSLVFLRKRLAQPGWGDLIFWARRPPPALTCGLITLRSARHP